MNSSHTSQIRSSFAFTTCAAIVLGATLPLASVRAAGSSSSLLQEIVVTAQRQKQSLLTIPESITSLDNSALSHLGVHSVTDLAGLVPDLSFQYGGGNGYQLGYGGGQVMAIRGISGANTTGLYIDNTPVPDTLDPQVVDLERVEVLEGPQGTLYGEGSMGGNVRLVTVPPAFHNELSYSVSGGYTDHAATPDGRTEVIGNTTLIPGVAAVRVVGFANHDGGFITREYPTGSGSQLASANNQGAVTDYGGSITLLIKPTSGVSITPRIMAQETNSHGLGSAFAPLPQFDVNSFTLVRAANIQEGYQDKWYLPSLEIKDTLGKWSLVSSTSYFHRYLNNLEDGTEGTEQQMSVFVPPSVFAGGVGWPQWTVNSNFYEEDRAAWSGTKYVHGIVGAFYSNEVMHIENGSPTFDFPQLVTDGISSSPQLFFANVNSSVTDLAGYGQAYFDLHGFELTVGARVFSLGENLEESSGGIIGLPPTTPKHTTQSGWTPKVSLSYTAHNGTMIYATASKGFRAGGNNVSLPPSLCGAGLSQLGVTESQASKFDSDSLWNYEIGAKGQVGNVALTGSAFEMVWNQIQQSVSVPVCFLSFTSNSGQARIRGVEFQAFGRPLPGLQARLSFSYEDPKITEKGLAPQPVGSRLYGVPNIIGSAALIYTHQISSDVDGFVSTSYSYTGNSVSNTTSSLFGTSPVTRAGYGILNAKIGAEWGKRKIWLYFRNITNVAANLGDINPIAFAQLDPTTGLPLPRVAVERPFQVGIGFSYGM